MMNKTKRVQSLSWFV